MSKSTSRRGDPLSRALDQHLGPALVHILGGAVRVKRAVARPTAGTDSPTLLVCFGAIGDLLLLSAVARAVCPGERFVLACTPENAPAATLYEDVYSAVETTSLTDPRSIARIVEKYGVGRIVDSTQWANVSALHLSLVGIGRPAIPIRGFRTPTRARSAVYTEVVEHSNAVHETQNFASLLGSPDFDPDALVTSLPAAGNGVALHLWPSGTRSYLKEWPFDYWAELARLLHAHGARLFVTGGPADRERNAHFIQRVGVPAINLAGNVSLKELWRLFETEIRMCVSVNTGTMHLAALAGATVVALNGPTDPKRWGPVGRSSVSLQPESGNFGYLNYGFEYPESDKDAYALDHLSVELVAETTTALSGGSLRCPARIARERQLPAQRSLPS